MTSISTTQTRNQTTFEQGAEGADGLKDAKKEWEKRRNTDEEGGQSGRDTPRESGALTLTAVGRFEWVPHAVVSRMTMRAWLGLT